MSRLKFLLRWKELTAQQQAFLVSIALSCFGVFIGLLGMLDFASSAWLGNLSTELIGSVVTYLVLERLLSDKLNQEEQEQARQKRKKLLLHQMRTADGSEEGRRQLRRDITELQELGCFCRDQLEDEDLRGYNLRNVDLVGVDFRGLTLDMVNFSHAILFRADLRNASLRNIDLEGARLLEANLKGANLTGANLLNAVISAQSISDGEVFSIEGAQLRAVLIDETTILPDGENYESSVDLKRFTDPNHNNFWSEDRDKASPAYWLKRVERKLQRD